MRDGESPSPRGLPPVGPSKEIPGWGAVRAESPAHCFFTRIERGVPKAAILTPSEVLTYTPGLVVNDPRLRSTS